MAKYRGLIHCHSRFSCDCMVLPWDILRFAERERLDFLVLTDHDTLDGARELQRLALSRGLLLEIPTAAEYRTDHGDIIAAFVEREIVSRDFDGFVQEVRDQGGVLLLPHPYDSHQEVEKLAAAADLVEVFNARSRSDHNAASLALAIRLNKPSYWASDAHIIATLSKVLIEVERIGTLKESLLCGAISPLRVMSASLSDVWLSQYIKAFKTRNRRLFIDLSVSVVKTMIRRIWRAS